MAVTITISGPRGAGKSVLALWFASALGRAGYTNVTTENVDRGLQLPDTLSGLPTPIVIRERWEPEEPTTFIDRLRAEHDELAGRIERLREFIGTDRYNGLTSHAQDDLREQLGLMEQYETVLARRIGRLG